MSDLLTELQNEKNARDLSFFQTLNRASRDRFDRSQGLIPSGTIPNPFSTDYWDFKRDIGDHFTRDAEVTVSLDDFNAIRNLPTLKRNYFKGGGQFTEEAGEGSGYGGGYESATDFINNFNIKDVKLDGSGNQITLRFTDALSADTFNEGLQLSKANMKSDKTNYNLGTYADSSKGYFKSDLADAKDIKLEERKQKLLDEMKDLKEGSDSRIDRLLDLKEKTKMKELDIIGGASGFDANSLIRNILTRVNAGNRGSSLPTQIRIGQ